MSSRFCVNLRFERAFSPRLLLLYALLFGSAILATGITAIPVLFKLVIFAALLAAAIVVLRRHILLLHSDSVVALRCVEEQWTVHTRNGNSIPVRLLSAAFWAFDIIPLVFESADGKHHGILLTPDRVQPDSLRVLRAWMRHRLPAA
jgi:hypothetical protein